MRSIVNKTWMLACAFFGLSAVSARAEEVIVNVPFPFVVNSRRCRLANMLSKRVGQDPTQW